MAIPPSMLFLFTLIPHLPFISKKAIKLQLNKIIVDIIPSKVYNQQLINFVDSFIYDNRIGLLSFGLLTALFFSSSAMMGLIRSFNKKHHLGFEKRTILSGIAMHFNPEDIVGKQVTIVANLAPRKMRGIESKGMILMAEDANGKLYFVSPSEAIAAGSSIA
jgi:predicted RNA-binding protein with EMAP domain